MQNLGFAFALIPLIRKTGRDDLQTSRLLNRHLRLFNTQTYLTGPLLGSIVKLEEQTHDGHDVIKLKNTLMGPYAAMGDTFFWGAWRPMTAIGTIVLMMQSLLWAPLIFLILYNPVPLYVRVRGFVEGYRLGAQGIEFIGNLNLPGLAGKIRWISIILLGILLIMLTLRAGPAYTLMPSLLLGCLFLGSILVCFWMLSRGISTMKILYGMVVLFLLYYSFF